MEEPLKGFCKLCFERLESGYLVVGWSTKGMKLTFSKLLLQWHRNVSDIWLKSSKIVAQPHNRSKFDHCSRVFGSGNWVNCLSRFFEKGRANDVTRIINKVCGKFAFLQFNVTPASCTSVSNDRTWSICLVAVRENMTISSKRTRENYHLTIVNWTPKACWNVLDTFLNPKDMQVKPKRPWCDA